MNPDGSSSPEKRTAELLSVLPGERTVPGRPESFATDNRGYYAAREFRERQERREARRRWLLGTVPGVLVLIGVAGVLVAAAVLLFHRLR